MRRTVWSGALAVALFVWAIEAVLRALGVHGYDEIKLPAYALAALLAGRFLPLREKDA